MASLGQSRVVADARMVLAVEGIAVAVRERRLASASQRFHHVVASAAQRSLAGRFGC